MENREEKRKRIIDLGLDTLDGLIITDEVGEILYISKKYASLMGTEPAFMMGKI